MTSVSIFPEITQSHGARIKLMDSVAWGVFLILLASASFINGGYATSQWLFFSACFYFWFCCALVLVACGGRCNWRAIKAARLIIVLFVLSLVCLSVPAFLSYDHILYEILRRSEFGLGSGLSWFQPEPGWAVAPERLRWLLMSELLFFCVFLSALALIDRRQRLRHILLLFICVGLVHAVIGLFGQIAGILFVEARAVDGHFSVARGLFVNRNHFGAFMVLSLMGAFAFQARFAIQYARQGVVAQLKEQFSSLYVLLLVALAVGFIACVSSGSRGAVLSLFAAISLLILTRKNHTLQNIRSSLILILIVVVVSLVYFGQEIIARFASDALSIGERAEQWRITLAAIMENPIMGYGGGSYSTVFQIFRSDTELRQVVFAQAHNHYLHLWLERGLIGLGLWLSIFWATIRQAHAASIQSRSSLVRGTMLAALVVIMAALIQSLVDFNLQVLNIRAYFLVVIAIVFAARQLKL